ncbi:MAG: hypothetical protein IKL29_06535, partial [Bacteroidaceae bacterium]|nr:hypothetical protein [Bacteroidaceae bacterium]
TRDRVYQKYVTEVGAAKNNHGIDGYNDVKYKYLAWADVFFRMYTIRGGKSDTGTYISYAVDRSSVVVVFLFGSSCRPVNCSAIDFPCICFCLHKTQASFCRCGDKLSLFSIILRR